MLTAATTAGARCLADIQTFTVESTAAKITCHLRVGLAGIYVFGYAPNCLPRAESMQIAHAY